MCTNEQQSTVQGLGEQTSAMNPEERRRRLRKVYDILLALAEQAEAAGVDTPCNQPQPAD
jgi:hypothetical protein